MHIFSVYIPTQYNKITYVRDYTKIIQLNKRQQIKLTFLPLTKNTNGYFATFPFPFIYNFSVSIEEWKIWNTICLTMSVTVSVFDVIPPKKYFQLIIPMRIKYKTSCFVFIYLLDKMINAKCKKTTFSMEWRENLL